jgi:hypothetical protein
MSMQELNRKMREYKVRPAALLLSLTLFVFSCKKKQEYVYDVNDETISAAGVQKPNVKSNTEFISIAHTDVMGTTVSAGNLNELKTQYLAFGDKGVVEDLIIRNFMNKSGNTIPTSIGTDKKAFVTNAYKKVYNRVPNEYEIYYLTDLLNKNSSITAEMFYYSLMTSNEYRQF